MGKKKRSSTGTTKNHRPAAVTADDQGHAAPSSQPAQTAEPIVLNLSRLHHGSQVPLTPQQQALQDQGVLVRVTAINHIGSSTTSTLGVDVQRCQACSGLEEVIKHVSDAVGLAGTQWSLGRIQRGNFIEIDSIPDLLRDLDMSELCICPRSGESDVGLSDAHPEASLDADGNMHNSDKTQGTSAEMKPDGQAVAVTVSAEETGETPDVAQQQPKARLQWLRERRSELQRLGQQVHAALGERRDKVHRTVDELHTLLDAAATAAASIVESESKRALDSLLAQDRHLHSEAARLIAGEKEEVVAASPSILSSPQTLQEDHLCQLTNLDVFSRELDGLRTTLTNMSKTLRDGIPAELYRKMEDGKKAEVTRSGGALTPATSPDFLPVDRCANSSGADTPIPFSPTPSPTPSPMPCPDPHMLQPQPQPPHMTSLAPDGGGKGFGSRAPRTIRDPLGRPRAWRSTSPVSLSRAVGQGSRVARSDSPSDAKRWAAVAEIASKLSPEAPCASEGKHSMKGSLPGHRMRSRARSVPKEMSGDGDNRGETSRARAARYEQEREARERLEKDRLETLRLHKERVEIIQVRKSPANGAMPSSSRELVGTSRLRLSSGGSADIYPDVREGKSAGGVGGGASWRQDRGATGQESGLTSSLLGIGTGAEGAETAGEAEKAFWYHLRRRQPKHPKRRKSPGALSRVMRKADAGNGVHTSRWATSQTPSMGELALKEAGWDCGGMNAGRSGGWAERPDGKQEVTEALPHYEHAKQKERKLETERRKWEETDREKEKLIESMQKRRLSAERRQGPSGEVGTPEIRSPLCSSWARQTGSQSPHLMEGKWELGSRDASFGDQEVCSYSSSASPGVSGIQSRAR